MKKILFGLTIVAGFFCMPIFASKSPSFEPRNVYKYDLKNLESDLKKDYTEKQCRDKLENNKTPCNMYQLKSNHDTVIRDFIAAMKKKDYKKASYITNANLMIMHSMFPHVDISSAIAGYGAIPFYKGSQGLLGLELHSQDSGFKFYYMTIKNNILYMIKMDGEFWDVSDYVKDPDHMSIEARDKNGKAIKVFELSDISNYPSSSWFLKYLQKDLVSKDLDERRIAFENKVVKYFASIK